MTVKYHVNPETGRPNQCKATVKSCKYAVGGEIPPHFDTKDAAKEHGEKILKNKYGVQSVRKDNAPKKAMYEAQIQDGIETQQIFNNTINNYELAKDIVNSVDNYTAIEFLKKRTSHDYSHLQNDDKALNRVIEERIDHLKASKAAVAKDIVSAQMKLTQISTDEVRIEQDIANEGKKAEEVSTSSGLQYVQKPGATFEEPSRLPMKNSYTGNGWVGSKVSGGYRPVKDIAKDIRNDIKAATDAGYLPQGLKYSVSTDTYSGGASINITAYGVGTIMDTHEYNPMRNQLELKPEYKELENKLNDISDSYNSEDSDLQIDYFNRGFYGRASLASESQEKYKEYETARRKINKVINDAKKSSMVDYNSEVGEVLKNDETFKDSEAKYYLALRKYKEANAYERGIFDKVFSASNSFIDKDENEKIRDAAERSAREDVDKTIAYRAEGARRFMTR